MPAARSLSDVMRSRRATAGSFGSTKAARMSGMPSAPPHSLCASTRRSRVTACSTGPSGPPWCTEKVAAARVPSVLWASISPSRLTSRSGACLTWLGPTACRRQLRGRITGGSQARLMVRSLVSGVSPLVSVSSVRTGTWFCQSAMLSAGCSATERVTSDGLGDTASLAFDFRISLSASLPPCT